MQKIKLREYDPNMTQPSLETMWNKDQGGSKIVLIGKASTGKSSALSSILYAKRKIFPIGMVMSGTEDSNSFYSRMFPSAFVFNKLDEKKIADFITRQKVAKRHLTNPWAVLILDDCMDDPKIFNKPLFQALYKNGRHWKMLFIVALQYAMDIRPSIRVNVDGVFIFREPSVKIRKVIWENYASIIPDFSLFCAIMDQVTGNYTALYIHNQTTSNNWQDCVFWYKATPPPPFKFGCKDFWKFNKQRFNPNYKESF